MCVYVCVFVPASSTCVFVLVWAVAATVASTVAAVACWVRLNYVGDSLGWSDGWMMIFGCVCVCMCSVSACTPVSEIIIVCLDGSVFVCSI